MASSLRLIYSAILFLSLIQYGHAKTSTENLIVNESDILELKKSSGIKEGDFFEDLQLNLDSYIWIVNLKNGPFSTKEKANQAALELKKRLGINLPKLPKEISILQKSKSPNNKNLNQANFFSWMITLSLGVYDSKDKAMQIAQELKAIQKVPENVFLTRETKDTKTSKFSEKITPEVSGKIFLSREATPIKEKTKHLILVSTKSNSLNVRKHPSSSSLVVASLLRGSKVPHIKNNTPENRDGSWFYVEYSKGKFGWVSSSYTKKIIDSGSMISQQASLKTVKPKQVQTSEAPRTSEFRKLKSLVVLLQTELNKIKADKVNAIKATNQANSKAKEERIASINEFNALKQKSYKQIKDLQITTASLHSELNLIKLDKAKAIEATNQANSKAKEERIASINEFNALKQKSYKQIKDLQITTASLHSELNLIKLDKAKAIEATNQANIKTKLEKLASANEFKSLKEKSSKQIKDLQTTTVSLRSELDKVKSEKTKAIEATNQANFKTKEEILASANEFKSLKEKSSKQIKDLQTTTVSLRSDLDKIKADKAKATEATNQANSKAKKERLASSNEKNMLKEKINTLRVVLDKFKTDREKTTQANIKSNEEKLANIKEFNTLKEKSSKQIKDLQTTTVSLSSELDKANSEKTNAIEATNQANTKANEERLAIIKEFRSLKQKSSKQINELQKTTVSLRSELDMIKADKARAIEAATHQIISKAKEETIASVNEFNTLKEKSSKQINELQKTTVSLRSELDKANSRKTKAIEATNQANTKANEERLAIIKEFRSLKQKSSKQINELQKTTVSLRSELDMIKADKARAIEASNQANSKAKEERLANANEKNALHEKINTLRVVLDKFKSDKEKTTQATIQANFKIKDEKLASINEFNFLKEKNSKQIKDLQTTTVSLRSELDKVKSEKTKVIEATNQANFKTKEEILASANEFKSLKEKSSKQIKDLQTTTVSLRSDLDKIKADKAKAIEASDRANSKFQAEKLANAKLLISLKVANEKEISDIREVNRNKIKNLKEKNLKENVDLNFSAASLQKELQKIKSEKKDAINALDLTNNKLQAEKLANAKLVASLKTENKKRVEDLKLYTATLQKEMQKIKGENESAIDVVEQTNAKLQTTNLNNIQFTEKLKDTVIFLRKELDKNIIEKTETIKAVNQTIDKLQAEKLANSAQINQIKEASNKTILDLKTTVASLRSELNKAKDDKTNKLTAINQASIKSNKLFKESSTREIKTLNSTIKNLRTVLERFKVERLKAVETRKSSETAIATEQTIREKEISLLKKETIVLKRQLDKANLDRVKTTQMSNRDITETQAGLFSQDNEFKEYRLKSTREIAKLRDETTSLRNQLAHLKGDRRLSTQPKTLLSSTKKLQGLTGPASTKQKNKMAGILDKRDEKKSISKNKLLPSSNNINPKGIINSELLLWLNAWESRNTPLYLSFYSKSFKDPKRSRSKWEAYRRKSLEKTLNISIQVSNIKIDITRKNIIRVSFVQRFKSNKYSDIGLKDLVWEKGTDGWKIIKETWKPR